MNTQKATQIIDVVTSELVYKVDVPFLEKVLSERIDCNKYKSVLDKWLSTQLGDFFDFYLNSSNDVQRYLLEAAGIQVEPDKYPDYANRCLELLNGTKSRWEIFPFEIEIVYQYVLFCNNHSLDVLKEVSPSAWNIVQEYGLDSSYCDFADWTAFWCKAAQEDKELLLDYIVTAK